MQCPKINIFSNITNIKKDYNSNHSYVNWIPNNLHTKNDVFVKSNNNPIAFTGIKNGSDLKNLLNRRKIHCIYCGRPMLSNSKVDELKKSGIFSAPIVSFAQEMLNYLEYLHPSEKNVLKRITVLSFEYPNITLSEAIKKLYFKANNKLLKKQMPILHELYELSDKLPQNLIAPYQKLIKISKYRLEEKAYIPDNFDNNEFVYKIKRLINSVKDDFIAYKIINLTKPLSNSNFNNSNPIDKKTVNEILRLCEIKDPENKPYSKNELQILLLNEIKKYTEVINRKDITSLCETAIKTINRQPVKINFSNKSLERALTQMTLNIPNNALKNKIKYLLKKLPTSETSTSAFIAKHRFADSDAIAYDLLRPSIVTIEHIKQKSKSGPNELSNYALSCGRDNWNRSDENLYEFIIDFPPKNQQKYFDELIQETNRRNLDKNILLEMVKNFTRESGVVIKTDKLK